MSVGRYTTDLDKGDVLGPVDYTMSTFVVREYCHANELHHPCYQGKDVRFAPPTLVHLDKLKLYKVACPEGTGPSARIHYQYDATIEEPVPVGEPLRTGDRPLREARPHLCRDAYRSAQRGRRSTACHLPRHDHRVVCRHQHGSMTPCR